MPEKPAQGPQEAQQIVPGPMDTTSWAIATTEDGKYVVLSEHTRHGSHVMFLTAELGHWLIANLTHALDTAQQAARDAVQPKLVLPNGAGLVVPTLRQPQ